MDGEDEESVEQPRGVGKMTLAFQKQHITRTHKRWVAQLDSPPPCDQCGGCRYWVPLTEPWGYDWGACTNPDSPNDGSVQFEHDGCAAFEHAERWTLPRLAREHHPIRDDPD